VVERVTTDVNCSYLPVRRVTTRRRATVTESGVTTVGHVGNRVRGELTDA
jgi:hypothetical protein